MDSTTQPGEFAALLRRFREAASLTQEELAHRAGMTPNGVGALERGERRRPYPHTVRALAGALDLDEDDRSALAAAAKPVPTRTTTPAGPDASLTPLVGRQGELSQVTAALTAEGTRLITVTGPGGVGKTRLALEAARQVAPRFSSTAVAELASLFDPDLVLPTIASSLGLQPVAITEVIPTVAAYVGDRRRLLVLDNLEHLLSAALDVANLLAACPTLVVLATSRAPLRIRGEQDFPLSPLPVPSGSRMADVASSDAAKLLLERARAVAPGFALTEHTATAVAAICRQLDGLPLALELAAAHARLLSPAALLSRLDRAVSSPRVRDLPERHMTVRATLDWSHDLLTAPEQVVLRRLSVFAGGFTLEAAEEVVDVDDAFGTLSGLLDQSMVLAQPDERYRLLEPVRQYAASRLASVGEAESVADRHAAYLCFLGHEARLGLRTDEQGHWLERLHHEHDNLRAALRHVLSQGQLGAACLLLSDTWLSWALRGYAGEGLEWTARIRSRAAAGSVGPLTSEDRAHLDLATAGLTYAAGRLTDTYSNALSAAESAAAAGLPGVHTDALILVGSAQVFTGALEVAKATLHEAERESRSLGDPWSSVHIRLAQGQRLLVAGALDEAGAVLDEAADMARSLASPFSLAVSLNLSATFAQMIGNDDTAVDRYVEAARLAAEVRTMWTLVYTLPGLAIQAAKRGMPDLAVTLFTAGAATSDASSLVAAFPPDVAAVNETWTSVRESLGDQAYQAAADRGRELRPDDVPPLAETIRQHPVRR